MKAPRTELVPPLDDYRPTLFLVFSSDCCVTQYGQCPSGSPHHHHYLDNVACEVKSYVYFCLKHLELGHDWSKCG